MDLAGVDVEDVLIRLDVHGLDLVIENLQLGSEVIHASCVRHRELHGEQVDGFLP